MAVAFVRFEFSQLGSHGLQAPQLLNTQSSELKLNVWILELPVHCSNMYAIAKHIFFSFPKSYGIKIYSSSHGRKIFYLRAHKISVPFACFGLHISSFTSSPSHSFPSPLGGGLSQYLTYVTRPSPHVESQPPCCIGD